MATSQEYIEFVCEQLPKNFDVRYRKMFGDYMVYVQDKPILLVCDSTVYVKKLPAIAEWMQDAPCGIPYEGSKDHYILDIERKELVEKVVTALEKVTPIPKKKKAKKGIKVPESNSGI